MNRVCLDNCCLYPGVVHLLPVDDDLQDQEDHHETLVPGGLCLVCPGICHLLQERFHRETSRVALHCQRKYSINKMKLLYDVSSSDHVWKAEYMVVVVPKMNV